MSTPVNILEPYTFTAGPTTHQSGSGSLIAAIFQTGSSPSAAIVTYEDVNGVVLSEFNYDGSLTVYGSAQSSFIGLATPTASIGSPTSGGTFTAGTYYWVVSALSTGNVLETVPSSQVTTTLTTNQKVTVSWGAVPGATGYNIYRSTVSNTFGSTSLLTTITNGLTTSYVDTGTATTTGQPQLAVVGTSVVIQAWASQNGPLLDLRNSANSTVAKVDSAGLATVTRINSLTTGSNTFATGTTNIAIIDQTDGTTSTTALEVVNANQTILGSISGDASATWYGQGWTFSNLAVTTAIALSPASGGSFAAGTYFWTVTSVNATGETIAATAVSTAVTLNQKVTVSWNQVSGATSYNVYRNTSNSFTSGSLKVGSVTNGGVSLVDTGAATTTGFPPATTTGSKLVKKAWAGQSGNSFEIQNSAGTAQVYSDNTGALFALQLGNQPQIADGRLVLQSGTPWPSGDVTGANHVYYTPNDGVQIALYYPAVTAWRTITFSEISIALSGLTTNSLYDVFLGDAGVPANAVVTGTVAGSYANGATITLPANNAGDLMAIFIQTTGSSGSLGNADWKKVIGQLGTATTGALFTKTSVGSETGPTNGTGTSFNAVAVVISGGTLTDVTTSNAGTSASYVANSVTPNGGSNDVLICLYANDALGTAPTPPGGQTSVTTGSMAIGYETLSSSGATGTRMATGPNNRYLTLTAAFAGNSSTGATLYLSSAWTTNTVRSDALTQINGVWVKHANTALRYLGTFMATAATTTEDSVANRNLYDYYNPTYSPTTNTNRIQFLGYVANNLIVPVSNAGLNAILPAQTVNTVLVSNGTNTSFTTAPVAGGGTGQTSFTNGQLLIGNTTGNTLTKATLTPGTSITITNGTGSITINGTAAAVKSDQTTGTSTTTFVNPGVQQNHASAAKAWAYFTVGAGPTFTITIQSSFNIASITRSSTGVYTVSFTTAFADTHYAVIVTPDALGGTGNLTGCPTGTHNTGSVAVQVTAGAGTLTDPSGCSVLFLGNQ